MWQSVWLQRTITWGGILLAWEVFARSVGEFFFPTIGSTLAGFVEVLTDGSLITLGGSLRQMFIGFGLAAVIGVPLGLIMGTSRVVGWLLDSYLKALFVTPLVAVLPFLIVLFGAQFTFRVGVVFIFCIFHTIVLPASGVRSIEPQLSEMTHAFGASRRKIFWSLAFPATLPFIMTGLRLALGQAVQGMIVAELWVSAGTGRRLIALSIVRELGELFALSATVAVTGAILVRLLNLLQRRLSPWATDVEATLRGAS